MTMTKSNESTTDKWQTLRSHFFWVSYIILLGVSMPHMAYFFSSFTDGSVFEWALSFLAASIIEGSIYVATFSIFQISKLSSRKWLRFWSITGLFGWILFCMSISWIANSAHAAHFHNDKMLTGTENIPGAQYFVYIAGAWPLFGLIYSMVSRVVTTNYTVESNVDPRTPQEIQRDTDRQIALLESDAKLRIAQETANARIRNAALSQRIGSTVQGVKQGILAAGGANITESEMTQQQPVVTISEATPLPAIPQIEAAHVSHFPHVVQDERDEADVDTLVPVVALQAEEDEEATGPLTPEPMYEVQQLPQQVAAKEEGEEKKQQQQQPETSEEGDVPQFEEINGIRVIDKRSGGFTTYKPMITDGKLTFVSVSSAYKENSHLSRRIFEKIAEEHLVDARLFRYVRYTFGNNERTMLLVAEDPRIAVIFVNAAAKLETNRA